MARTYITMAVKHVCVSVTEHLRYAGIIEVYGGGHTGAPPLPVGLRIPNYLRREPGWYLVTMECPPGHRVRVWLRQNMARLASFNVFAVGWQRRKTGQVLVLGTTQPEEGERSVA